MWLWNEMRDKRGFGEGDATPVECWEARSVLTTLVNSMKTGSWVAISFDGNHNPCMILLYDEEGQLLEDDPEELIDILDAIESSDIIYDLVKTTVTIVPEAGEAIKDFASKWKSGEMYLKKEG